MREMIVRVLLIVLCGIAALCLSALTAFALVLMASMAVVA